MCSLAIVTDILLLVTLPAVTNGIFAVKEVVFKEKDPSCCAVIEFTALAKTMAQQSLPWPMNICYTDIFRVEMCMCIFIHLSQNPLNIQEAKIFLVLFVQWSISLGIHYSS